MRIQTSRLEQGFHLLFYFVHENDILKLFSFEENAMLLSCINDGTIDSKDVSFTSCISTNDQIGSAVDVSTGNVIVPIDGYYEVTFTGAFKTFDGKRIWATIVKKSDGAKGILLTNEHFKFRNFLSLSLMNIFCNGLIKYSSRSSYGTT